MTGVRTLVSGIDCVAEGNAAVVLKDEMILDTEFVVVLVIVGKVPVTTEVNLGFWLEDEDFDVEVTDELCVEGDFWILDVDENDDVVVKSDEISGDVK